MASLRVFSKVRLAATKFLHVTIFYDTKSFQFGHNRIVFMQVQIEIYLLVGG